MGYHEQKWLQPSEEWEVILCHRYVDGIVSLSDCESNADKFFDFLNQKHTNIKLGIEKQTHNLFFVRIKITTLFKRRVSIILWSFSS